jgi:uncharacterized protein YkwD
MIIYLINLFLLSTIATSGILLGISDIIDKTREVKGSMTSERSYPTPTEKLVVSTSITETEAEIISSPSVTPEITYSTPTSPNKKSSIPTITPVSIPSVTPITLKPSATIAPSPFPTTDQSTIPSNGLNADTLFSLVNNYRQENGKPLFTKDESTCSIASLRAAQVNNEIYGTSQMHAGLNAMQLPYRITENIISYSTEEEAFNWWKNDYIHRIQMLGDFNYSCTACSGNSCSQVFTSYISK